jgi:hypothetical protein
MSLPDLFPFTGDWTSYENELYEIYLETMVRSGIKFRGSPVRTKYLPATKAKGFGFWHLISEGETEEDRIPDFRRCERIRWVAWLIENAEAHKDLSWWENMRGTDKHIVIWHETENFAVILAVRKNYYLLKTAYLVREYRRKDFERERREFLDRKKG